MRTIDTTKSLSADARTALTAAIEAFAQSYEV